MASAVAVHTQFPSEKASTNGRKATIAENNGGLRVTFVTGSNDQATHDYGYDSLGSVGWDVTAWIELKALPKGARKIAARPVTQLARAS